MIDEDATDVMTVTMVMMKPPLTAPHRHDYHFHITDKENTVSARA